MSGAQMWYRFCFERVWGKLDLREVKNEFGIECGRDAIERRDISEAF